MGPERNNKSSSVGNGNNPNVRQPYNPMGAHHHLQVNVYYVSSIFDKCKFGQMFNLDIDDLAVKSYIQHKRLIQ